MRLTTRIAALVAAAGLTLIAAGCTNPFTPAKPAPPIGGGVIPQFGTPEQLLTTIASAISTRGVSGQNAYAQSLADSTSPTTLAFYAFHAPTVVDAWKQETSLTPPDPWDSRLELLFYSYLAERLPTFTYSFVFLPDNLSSSDPPVDEVNGLAMVHRHYYLYATSQSIQKIIAVGYADLYMQKVNSRWYLYRWEDRVDPDYGVHPSDPDEVCMGRRRLDSTSGAS